jgi:hypothetical protein
LVPGVVKDCLKTQGAAYNSQGPDNGPEVQESAARALGHMRLLKDSGPCLKALGPRNGPEAQQSAGPWGPGYEQDTLVRRIYSQGHTHLHIHSQGPGTGSPKAVSKRFPLTSLEV